MLWIWLILATVVIWVIVNIADKHIVTDELKDPSLCAVVYGAIAFIFYSIIGFSFKIGFAMPISAKLAAFGAGIALNLGTLFYYSALKQGEVSRVIPLFNIGPLFVLLLATLFLNEIFTPVRYLAIGLLVAGGWLISIKKINKKNKNKSRNKRKERISLMPALLFVLIGALMYAFRSILVRYATFQTIFIQLLPWLGLGMMTVAVISFTIHHPRIRRKLQIRGIEHLVVINVISVLTLIIFIRAIAIAPAVSFVIAFAAGIQGFLVFISAVLLSKFKPKIVHEPLTRRIILMKIIAIVLLTAGVILIV